MLFLIADVLTPAYAKKNKPTKDAKASTPCEFNLFTFYYLFTWNLVQPSLKKALICLAAAIPALMLASAV